MGREEDFQKLSPLENTIVGILVGIFEVSVMQPTLYLKNASQQGLPYTLDPRKLYRGLAMSITNMSGEYVFDNTLYFLICPSCCLCPVLTGLQFPLTGIVTTAITGNKRRPLSATEQISAGFVGGALSGIACAPMELVLIQQQRFGGSIVSTPGRIISSFGTTGLFRGLAVSCGREGVFTAGYLGIGPALTSHLVHDQDMSPVSAKVWGALVGGVIAGTLSHPMDTIKSCQQGDLEQKVYTTVTQTARTLLGDGGVRRLFRGWGFRTGRMIVGVGLINEFRYMVAPILFPRHFDE